MREEPALRLAGGPGRPESLLVPSAHALNPWSRQPCARQPGFPLPGPPAQARTAPGSSGSSARSLHETPLPAETGGEQGLGRPISQIPLNKAQAGGGGFYSRVLGARTRVHADRDRHTGQLRSPRAEARCPQEAGGTKRPGSGKDRSAGARVTPKSTAWGQHGRTLPPTQHPPRDCSWSWLPGPPHGALPGNVTVPQTHVHTRFQCAARARVHTHRWPDTETGSRTRMLRHAKAATRHTHVYVPHVAQGHIKRGRCLRQAQLPPGPTPHMHTQAVHTWSPAQYLQGGAGQPEALGKAEGQQADKGAGRTCSSPPAAPRGSAPLV